MKSLNSQPPYYQEPPLPLSVRLLSIIGITIYSETCIELIHRLERGGASFNICSAVKYLWRLNKKNKTSSDDLIKTRQYLLWELDHTQEEFLRQSKTISQISDLLKEIDQLLDSTDEL